MKLPQLSLRELLLLVVIAAMGCGWWAHAQRLNSALIDAAQVLKQTKQAHAKQVSSLENARDMAASGGK